MRKPNVHIHNVSDYVSEDGKHTYKLVDIGHPSGSWSRTHIYCTGCGKGALYKLHGMSDGYYGCRCPFCNTTFIHFEDEVEDDA